MKRIAFLLLCLVIVGVWIAGQAVPTAQTGKKYPPRFPSPTSKKLFENDRVIVWDEITPTAHLMHQHVLDALWFDIQDGPVETMDESGKIRNLPFSNTTQSGPSWGGYTKSGGRGPHSDRSLDPTKLRRRFVVEFKGTQPADCKDWSTDPICK